MGLRHCRAVCRSQRYLLCGCLFRGLHSPQKNTCYEDGRPGFDAVPQPYIDPVECIDCGACVRSALCQRSFRSTICRRNGSTTLN